MQCGEVSWERREGVYTSLILGVFKIPRIKQKDLSVKPKFSVPRLAMRKQVRCLLRTAVGQGGPSRVGQGGTSRVGQGGPLRAGQGGTLTSSRLLSSGTPRLLVNNLSNKNLSTLSMCRAEYQAVIVGGGHNGLVTAAYLARYLPDMCDITRSVNDIVRYRPF